MAKLLQPVTDTGLTIVYEPVTAPKMDIIFIHGLQGHPYKTWACRKSFELKRIHIPGRFKSISANVEASGPSESGGEAVFWPRDLLPSDCPECRVMTWGYNSHVSRFFGGPANQNSVLDHAKDLLYAIDRDRIHSQGRGIIFVAHSLGGIIVKEVLRSAQSDDRSSVHDIYASTRAVCFLGTPHRGSRFASYGNNIRGIVAALGFDTNDRNIRTLDFDNVESQLCREEFIKNWRTGAFEVRTFQESRGLTGVRGLSGKVVSDFSSSLEDSRERAQHIDANHMEMCRFPNREATGYKQVAGEIKSLVIDYSGLNRSRQVQDLLESNSRLETKVIEDSMLQSLAFPEIDLRHQRIDMPSTNTCHWLESLAAYQNWSLKGYGFLWLKGKAGAGKSTLMKHALEEVRAIHRGSGTIVTGYFHDIRGSPLEKSVVGLFRSILYQFLVQDRAFLSQYVSSDQIQLKMNLRSGSREWRVEELQEICVNFMKSWRSSPVFIFIDAMDEGDPSQTRKILDFWERLIAVASANGNDLRILLSSRHYPNISLQGCPEIVMEHHNMEDISTHVQNKLGSVSSEQENRELISIIVAKASGVFLWVVLVVEMMLRAEDEGETFGQKRWKLEQLPEELEELFVLILGGLSAQERLGILRILKWVALAGRRLMSIEVCFALLMETPNPPCTLKTWQESEAYIRSEAQMLRMLRSRSRGLVEIKNIPYENLHAGGAFAVVQLIHETLADFLYRRGFQLLSDNLASSALGRCHNEIARCCLKYLSNSTLCYETLNDLNSLNSEFESHAADPVKELSGQSEPPGTADDMGSKMAWQQTLEPDALNLGPSKIDEACSVQTESTLNQEPGESKDSRLHSLITNVLRHPLEYQLFHKYNYQDKRINYPFLDYSIGGLLYHSQRADAHGLDQSYLVKGLSGVNSWVFDAWKSFARSFSPLNIEFENEACTLLQLLAARNIRSGVRYMLNDGHCMLGPDLDKALRVAASFGHSMIVEFLLKAGANPKSSDSLGSTALHIVGQLGHALVAKILLKERSLANATTMFGWTPLHMAADHSHLHVLQALLDAQADLEIKNADGNTPLLLAVRRGSIEVVDTLIRAGADLGIKDPFQYTVLHLAAQFNRLRILRLLLSQNAVPIDARSTDGFTALAVAYMHRHDESAKVLLRHGAKAVKKKGLYYDVGPDRSMTASPDPDEMRRVFGLPDLVGSSKQTSSVTRSREHERRSLTLGQNQASSGLNAQAFHMNRPPGAQPMIPPKMPPKVPAKLPL